MDFGICLFIKISDKRRFCTIPAGAVKIILYKILIMNYQLIIKNFLKPINKYYVLFFCMFLYSTMLYAQDYKNLTLLPNYQIKVYYSAGHEQRAKNIAALCQNAINYNSNLLGFKPEVTLLILSADDWNKHTSFPVYGMAHYTDKKTLIVASSDNAFWKSFIPSPDKINSEIINTYTNTSGSLSMQPFFDLLVLHELGHAFHIQGGLKMQKKWMGELFCNILLHTYIAENEPNYLAALTAFPKMVIAEGSAGFIYTTLTDFETRYEELGIKMPNNYGWYQSRLHDAAKYIYDAAGKEALQKLWVALKENQDKLTDEQFAELLSAVHPSVANVMLRWDTNVKRGFIK